MRRRNWIGRLAQLLSADISATVTTCPWTMESCVWIYVSSSCRSVCSRAMWDRVTDQIGHSPSPRRMSRTTEPGAAYTSDDSIAGSHQAMLRRTSRATWRDGLSLVWSLRAVWIVRAVLILRTDASWWQCYRLCFAWTFFVSCMLSLVLMFNKRRLFCEHVLETCMYLHSICVRICLY